MEPETINDWLNLLNEKRNHYGLSESEQIQFLLISKVIRLEAIVASQSDRIDYLEALTGTPFL